MNKLHSFFARLIIAFSVVVVLPMSPVGAAPRDCSALLARKFTQAKAEEVATDLNHWVKVTLALPRSAGYSLRLVTARENTLRKNAYLLRREADFRRLLTRQTLRLFADWDQVDRLRAAGAKASEELVQFPSFTERYASKLSQSEQEKQDVAVAFVDHMETTARFPRRDVPEQAELAEKIRIFSGDVEFLGMLPPELAVRVPALAP